VDQNIDKTYQTYVKVDGEKYLISVDHTDEAMKRWMGAINREVAPLGPILKASARITRLMAALNTSFAPEFLMSNFVKDIQTSAIHLEDSEAKGMQKEIFGNIKAAIKGIYAAERGDESSDWAKIYRKYAENGGKIGWMQTHENITDLAKDIEKELAYKEGKYPTREKLRKLGDWIEAMNTAVENGVRLSMYKSLVDKDVDPKRAAMAAKSLTVDFTQHGTAGPVINSLYMFANAGIQGNVRMIQALARSAKVRKIAAGIVAFGAAANLMGVFMGGDDDDDEAYYDKLKKTNPDMFERNMVFMIPGTKGKFWKMPMPYGYNTFFVLGNEIASAARGKGAGAAAARVGSALMGSLNPLYAASLLQTITPTLGDPVAQIAENKAWHGGALRPEQNIFGVPIPESERYFKSVNPVAKWLAQNANWLTGGDKYKPGLIDVSPEVLEMIWETYSGSAGRLAKDALTLPFAPFADGGLSVNKTPGIRKLFGTKPEYLDNVIYQQNNREVDIFAARVKGANDQERADLQKDPLYKILGLHKSTDNQLRRLNKQMKSADKNGNKEAVERIKKEMTALKVKYNRQYNGLLS